MYLSVVVSHIVFGEKVVMAHNNTSTVEVVVSGVYELSLFRDIQSDHQTLARS
jgi:hypothetical protein